MKLSRVEAETGKPRLKSPAALKKHSLLRVASRSQEGFEATKQKQLFHLIHKEIRNT